MTTNTSIEWTDTSWNPVAGCTKVSPGCKNCYAMTSAMRIAAAADARERAGGTLTPRQLAYSQVVKRRPIKRGADYKAGVPLPQWNNRVVCIEEALGEPLTWRKPRRVFVNSTSDLFHEDVPFEFIDRVWAVMALCPRHTFQVLTKRPERMAEYLASYKHERYIVRGGTLHPGTDVAQIAWPLPNVWLGTSCEDQAAADARLPHLLRCPAAVRWLSCEPLLGPVNLNRIPAASWGEQFASPEYRGIELSALYGGRGTDTPWHIDWAVVGGESGANARVCDVAWVRSIVRQCRAAGVPCFVKQLGAVVWDRNDAGFDGDPDDAWDYAKIVDVEHHPDGDTTVYQGAPVRVRLHSKKGGDPAEWPDDLRVREYPGVAC